LVGQKYDPYVLQSLEEGRLAGPTKPTYSRLPDGTIDEMEKMEYSKRYDRWLTLVYKIEVKLKQVYSMHLGQHDEDMKASLSKHPEFKTINSKKDMLKLIKLLQSVNFNQTDSEEPIVSMFKAKLDFMRIRQQKGQTVNEYFERFIAMMGVNETLNTNLLDDLGFPQIIAREKKIDLSTLTGTVKDDFETAAMEAGRDRMLAIHLLFGADPEFYGGLLKDLRHSYLMNKRNDYPKTLQAAYVLLKGWNKGKTNNSSHHLVGMGFNVNGNKEKYFGPPCPHCGRTNHPLSECVANKHVNGTILHIDGKAQAKDEEKEAEGEVHDDVICGTIGNDVLG
jgi:hypothetical protein